MKLVLTSKVSVNAKNEALVAKAMKIIEKLSEETTAQDKGKEYLEKIEYVQTNPKIDDSFSVRIGFVNSKLINYNDGNSVWFNIPFSYLADAIEQYQTDLENASDNVTVKDNAKLVKELKSIVDGNAEVKSIIEEKIGQKLVFDETSEPTTEEENSEEISNS